MAEERRREEARLRARRRRADPQVRAREYERRKQRYAESPRVRDTILRCNARSNSREYAKERRRAAQYGTDVETLRRLVEEQGGLCALCGRPPRGKRALVVDHDHLTGGIRAMLCNACNSGIGHLGDSADLCRRAADYLDRHAAA